LISPFERFRHGAVVVLDKSQDLAFQVVGGNEVATLDNFSNQDTEPNFDLVHPGSMFGCVMKNNAMGWVAQKGSPRSVAMAPCVLFTQIDTPGRLLTS
jgi:hypothetical protein